MLRDPRQENRQPAEKTSILSAGAGTVPRAHLIEEAWVRQRAEN